MPKKKASAPGMKEQIAKIGLGVVKLQESVSILSEKMATKEELSAVNKDLKQDINALKEIVIDQYMEIHAKTHEALELT